MRAPRQRELTLHAPTGFRLPALGGQPLEARVFTSVYYDVPDGSLAAAGITLLRRTEGGRSAWQLRLPAEDSRLELEEDRDPGQPPSAVLKLLQAHLRHGPLERDRRATHAAERRARRARRDDRGGDRGRGCGARRAPCARSLRRGGARASLGSAALSTSSRESWLPPARSRRRPLPSRRRPTSRTRRSRLCAASCASSYARSSGTTQGRGSAATPRACTTCASPFAARGRCCARGRS